MTLKDCKLKLIRELNSRQSEFDGELDNFEGLSDDEYKEMCKYIDYVESKLDELTNEIFCEDK